MIQYKLEVMMASKRKKDELRAKKEKRRLKNLERSGRLANGVEMPPGAIPADLSEQAPNNTYSPKVYYQDIEFTCVDCGAEDVWTAKDQKWYFEVVKGSIYSGPKRCRECRKKFREMQAEQRQRMDEAAKLRVEAELLLSNAANALDYAAACQTIRKMGLYPEKIPHHRHS